MPDPNKARQKQYSAPLSRHPRSRFAIVEGKTSKQFHPADGNDIHMLNLFVHDFNLTLQQVVKNGKEISCTKRHFVILQHGMKLDFAYFAVNFLSFNRKVCKGRNESQGK